jgi:hypothetical protein
MSHSPRTYLVTLFALALTGCRYQAPAVSLQGDDTDISVIAGRWSGEYAGVQSGRSGSILFTVQAGKDTAYGDVMMTPQLNQALRAADHGSAAHGQHVSSPDLLRVTFIRVRGGSVEGSLEPYIAPDCSCVVTTVFRGRLAGNEIKGNFETRGASGMLQTGTWSVTRKASE